MNKQKNNLTIVEERTPYCQRKLRYLTPSFELTLIKIELDITQSSGQPEALKARIYEDWDMDVEIDGGEVIFWD